MRITDVTDVTRHAQDPIYMQDLGKIKTLLEEGVLTEVEFNTKKAELIKQRKERKESRCSCNRQSLERFERVAFIKQQYACAI